MSTSEKNCSKAWSIFSAHMEILPLLHKMKKYKETFGNLKVKKNHVFSFSNNFQAKQFSCSKSIDWNTVASLPIK